MTNDDTMRRRRRLADAQDGICPWCEQPLPADLVRTEIDHIIPRSRGGPNVAWNRRLLHFLCNKIKHNDLTAEAMALAEEHGIVLHEPTPPVFEPSPYMQQLIASGPPAFMQKPRRGW